MTNTDRATGTGRVGIEGQQPGVVVTYPWTGKPWAEQADAANRGLQGQGYIVHAVMMVNRYGLPLAIIVIGLTAVETAVAVYQAVCQQGGCTMTSTTLWFGPFLATTAIADAVDKRRPPQLGEPSHAIRARERVARGRRAGALRVSTSATGRLLDAPATHVTLPAAGGMR